MNKIFALVTAISIGFAALAQTAPATPKKDSKTTKKTETKKTDKATKKADTKKNASKPTK